MLNVNIPFQIIKLSQNNKFKILKKKQSKNVTDLLNILNLSPVDDVCSVTVFSFAFLIRFEELPEVTKFTKSALVEDEVNFCGRAPPCLEKTVSGKLVMT
jgi:hypothetical protein